MSNQETEPVDIFPDVYAQGRLVSPLVAWHAARTALKLYYDHENLPFAKMSKEYQGGGGIVTLGIYSPLEYSPDGTIFGHPRIYNKSVSFMRAVKQLIRFSGAHEAESHYLRLMLMPDGEGIGVHRDLATHRRSFLQLLGHREATFIGNIQNMEAETSIVLAPGDAYCMQFREGNESVLHSVAYEHPAGGEGCLAAYINIYDEDE